MRGSQSGCKPQIHGLVFAAVACLPATVDASASPSSYLVGIRLGTAQEAQQGTLKSGGELGLTFDRVAGRAVDLGMGLAVAYDPGGGSSGRNRVTITSVEAHMRTSLAQRHPCLEGGLGYYWLAATQDQSAPGVFAGLGYEFRGASASGLGVTLGLDYHMIFAEISRTANLEDYYTFTATARWGRRAP